MVAVFRSTTNNGYMLYDIQDENIDLRTKLSDVSLRSSS